MMSLSSTATNISNNNGGNESRSHPPSLSLKKLHTSTTASTATSNSRSNNPNNTRGCSIAVVMVENGTTVVLSRRAVHVFACVVFYLFGLQCFTLYTVHYNYYNNNNNNNNNSNTNNSHSHYSTATATAKRSTTTMTPTTGSDIHTDAIAPVRYNSASSSSTPSSPSSASSSLVEQNRINKLLLHSNNNSHSETSFTCRWYVAESAIPNSGLGIFTGIGLHMDEDIGYPDICLYVSDGDFDRTQLSSHTWGASNYFGSIEGRHSRAACEGLVTIANTYHPALINTALISQEVQTNAGLHRQWSPGAGAITHNYGIHGRARDIITAGSELIVDYFDWDFSDITEPIPPQRDIAWLQKYGWCVDKMDIRLSQIPHAGRGAFARITMARGEVLTPAPLQVFKSRTVFQTIEPEQLMVNYCLQPENSTMMFFPYGQAAGLINHSSKKPNVEYRWSTKEANVHHPQWLDLSLPDFWKVTKAGGLILEIVALRDIHADEEILIDYGSAWETAWEEHVSKWKPPKHADQYVYPAEMDETAELRTVQEQITQPYPSNLATVCVTPDFDREDERHTVWEEPNRGAWYDAMTLCHTLSRQVEPSTGYITYNVSLIFSSNPDRYVYDPNIAVEELYVDSMVPRRAIRFIEIPYMDDEHLLHAFRHPMGFPNALVPNTWRNIITNENDEEDEEEEDI